MGISIPDHSGESYHTTLKRLHRLIKPATYLEIGTRAGESLAYAQCPSIAIDPIFKLDHDSLSSKEECHLYQMTSDRFFEKVNVELVLGGKIRFAFLDGMHLFEFLLRDFINTERTCHRHSVIALHDCLPTDARYASRFQGDVAYRKDSAHPGWWAGDVWKVGVILKRFRPDLRIVALDASPTGLILVTSLDPKSDVLSVSYDKILDEFGSMTLEEFGVDSLMAELGIVSTMNFQTLEDVSRSLLV